MQIRWIIAPLSILWLLAACAPAADGASSSRPCVTQPIPVVAIVDFENTTGTRGGVTVTGVEDAAVARLITLLKGSGCYEVVERSELVNILTRQGLESMAPEALARAAGAAYVITGTVTRATIARPQVAVAGVSVGATRAEVDIDVRATDIITGQVVVSVTGRGQNSQPNLSISRLLPTTIAFNDAEVGPLLANAAEEALLQVVNSVRARF
jgi:curli biogenesis system outer membrane secretion channel CsgG